MGSSCRSTRYTVSPFAKVKTVGLGSTMALSGPGLGGVARHACAASNSAVCCGVIFTFASVSSGLRGTSFSTFLPGMPYTTTR